MLTKLTSTKQRIKEEQVIGKLISGDRQIGLENLILRGARAASAFLHAGVDANKAVALLLRNDVALFEASRGAGQIGAYTVPINWHSTSDEIHHILRDCEARVLVVHADLLKQTSDEVLRGLQVIVVATPPEISSAYDIAPTTCDVPSGMIEGASKTWGSLLACLERIGPSDA